MLIFGVQCFVDPHLKELGEAPGFRGLVRRESLFVPAPTCTTRTLNPKPLKEHYKP